jgi:hypothetical protein
MTPVRPPRISCQALNGAMGFTLLPIVSLAIVAVSWSCGSVLAEPAQTASSGYLTIGSAVGNYDGDNDEGSWRGNSVSGAFKFSLPSGLNLQVTGRMSDYALGESINPPVWDTDNQNMLSAAVFWRVPSMGLIGATIETGEIKAWYDHRFNSIGVFGEIYPNNVSALGANVTFTDNKSGVNTAISSQDQTYEVWGEYFLNENMAMRMSAAHQTSKHDFISNWHENIIGVSGEYFLRGLTGMDASLTAGYFHATYADSDRKSNQQIRIGMRWFFGRPENLLDARRNGAVETRYNNYVDVPRWWQFPL